MAAIITQSRFDDVGPEGAGSDCEWSYRGVNYEIVAASRTFNVRTYDDEPNAVVVVAPENAGTLGEVRELVEFLVGSLAATQVKFYCGTIGAYKAVDLRTLEFTT